MTLSIWPQHSLKEHRTNSGDKNPKRSPLIEAGRTKADRQHGHTKGKFDMGHTFRIDNGIGPRGEHMHASRYHPGSKRNLRLAAKDF